MAVYKCPKCRSIKVSAEVPIVCRLLQKGISVYLEILDTKQTEMPDDMVMCCDKCGYADEAEYFRYWHLDEKPKP